MAAAAAVAKKAPSTKKPKSHPTYAQMVKEAIVALKERSGSSQYAIAKHIEDNHQKDLPSNFKKMLLVQLKKLVAAGKLTKVKNSFKLGSSLVASEKKKTTVVKKAVAAKKAPPAAAAGVKKTVAPKAKATNKVKAASKEVKKTPAKKAVKKTGPVKTVAKRPKSIKSPVKKVAVKKAKK